LNLAADPTQSEAARTAATQLLGVSTLNVGLMADWLLLVCNPPTGPALQSAAVEALSRYDDPKVVDALVQLWPVLVPVARNTAITALLARPSHFPALLNALQTGSISPRDLTPIQKNFLRSCSIPEIRMRAIQLLGPVPFSRPEVIARFKPALTLRGVSDRGRQVFSQRCVGCHPSMVSIKGTGLGPDLLETIAFSKDKLLSKIIEPDRNIRPDYLTQILESNGNEKNLVGIVSGANQWTLALSQVGSSKLIWPQLNVASINPQSWSLMPDGLEQGLSVQDMADLIEYLLRGRR
jgi:putative heme-binding domain-containing protein